MRPALLLLLALAALPVHALDYQLHGFAAQGFAWSSGNDVLGDSTRGTSDFRELGVNATVELAPGWLAAGQLLVRRAGAADDGDPRLDYGLVDWRFLREGGAAAGLRVGKVRNPFGFYNDTRDVVFSRPGILLPDSVYSDLSNQQRSVLFASDGVQAYAEASAGDHALSLTAGIGRSRAIEDEEEQVLIDLDPHDVRVHLSRFRMWRLLDDIDGGRWQLALSHVHVAFDVDTDLGLSADLAVNLFALSARYNLADFSFTAEYSPQRTAQHLDLGAGPQRDTQWIDGGYLQGDWRFAPRWQAFGRVEGMWADRSDRDGSRCEAQGLDRHQCRSYDLTLGLRWLPDAHWGLWAEAHAIDGQFSKYSLLDNRARDPADRWGLLLLMAAWRF